MATFLATRLNVVPINGPLKQCAATSAPDAHRRILRRRQAFNYARTGARSLSSRCSFFFLLSRSHSAQDADERQQSVVERSGAQPVADLCL